MAVALPLLMAVALPLLMMARNQKKEQQPEEEIKIKHQLEKKQVMLSFEVQ